MMNSFHFRLLGGIAVVLLLSGCESLTALQSNAVDTWSGVQQVVSGASLNPQDYIDGVVDGVETVKNDIDTRVENVTEGVRSIQEGRERIRQGLGIGGSGTLQN